MCTRVRIPQAKAKYGFMSVRTKVPPVPVTARNPSFIVLGVCGRDIWSRLLG